MGDIDVVLDAAGFLFEGDQTPDAVGLDARVFAKKRRDEVIGFLRDHFVHLEQLDDEINALLTPLANESERVEFGADQFLDLLPLAFDLV